MAFTEFCCRSGGSNMNAGSVDGSSTEPATTALVTYTGGDWNATTDVYTAPVGADMTEAQVGRFASLYHDGDTSPTSNQFLVARITAVNAGTRQITLSTSARSLLGTEVATGTANRTLKIGGSWAGPSGASGFPFTFIGSSLTDSNTNRPRVNFKNDQTYSITAAITAVGAGPIKYQGYGSTFGDGGRCIVDGGTSGASYTLLTVANAAGVVYQDFIFQNNGASGSSSGVICTNISSRTTFVRCVANNLRGRGFLANSNVRAVFIECEAYSCNQSGTAGVGAFECVSGSWASFIRCISHDNTGHGFRVTMPSHLDHCIADSNSLIGFEVLSESVMLHCDAYNNGSHGAYIGDSGSSGSFAIQSCNFVKNGGYGLTLVSGMTVMALVSHCGFGAGTNANTSGQTNVTTGTDLVEIEGTVTYANDVTPWVDPANGDFRITLSAAKGAGRGTFTQTASSYSGTVGYPDIGAAQHQDSGGGTTVIVVEDD